MFKKIFGGVALCVAFAGTANAGTVSGETITGTGCNSTGTCFINLSGNPFGPAACSSRQITFNGTTSQGRSLYATALTASASGAEIRVGFSDTVCNGSNPSLTFLTLL